MIDGAVQGSTVAYDEELLRKLYDESHLEIRGQIRYGSWCGVIESKGVKTDNLLQHSFSKGSQMTRPNSSTSTMIKRVWQGLLILVFVICIWGIDALSTYYVRSRSPDVYTFSGGSGELWLTLIALIVLEEFLIVSLED